MPKSLDFSRLRQFEPEPRERPALREEPKPERSAPDSSFSEAPQGQGAHREQRTDERLMELLHQEATPEWARALQLSGEEKAAAASLEDFHSSLDDANEI